MNRTINVEQRHIDAGNSSSEGCPVALAINDALDIRNTFVGYDTIMLSVAFPRLFRPTPVAAKLFISNFDNGREVKPFSFELDIP